MNGSDGIVVTGNISTQFQEILTPQALEFIAALHRKFNPTRLQLLQKRDQRQAEIDSGRMPDFLAETESVRNDPTWKVAPIPEDLQNRRVEITGPVERKMMINALNSGANVFMADFEDANSPTWENVIDGQINLRDAINRTISFTNPTGKHYKLNDDIAVLLIRPRGWHLHEKHILIDGEPASASLVDFGLYFFHNAKALLDKGSGPYLYLPKLESHLEARLWNDVFKAAQDALGVDCGAIKATVLIENILAAFEIEEILYELRQHIAGLNAGRWDYIFSAIKKFRNYPDIIFPDRDHITMTAPFMRAYTELLVKTCHKRGAHAIGGMAAFIPSRKDAEVNEIALAKVREDKNRESQDGFDGTWVAHPDLVPVAREPFDKILNGQPHQKDKLREDVTITAKDLLNFNIENSAITEAGLRNNISVGLQYMESWLRGIGAVGIYNLMEDAATAEISRSQIWQWIHNEKARLADGREIDAGLFKSILSQELDKVRDTNGNSRDHPGKFDLAAELFDTLVTEKDFADFLTLIAYEHLN